MPAHGPTTVVEIPTGIPRATAKTRWSHQLRSWWTAHHAARHHARLAMLQGRWDARREVVIPSHADAALDMIAPTHACATATALGTLAL
jgi:hypothetical protein